MTDGVLNLTLELVMGSRMWEAPRAKPGRRGAISLRGAESREPNKSTRAFFLSRPTTAGDWSVSRKSSRAYPIRDKTAIVCVTVESGQAIANAGVQWPRSRPTSE